MTSREIAIAEVEKAAARIDERIEALTARYKSPAAGSMAAALVTLDGSFEAVMTMLSMSNDSVSAELKKEVVEIAGHAILCIAKNIAEAGGIDKSIGAQMYADAIGVMQERRRLPDTIEAALRKSMDES